MTGAELSALVSTRICHDLISPIGAISNGVELLGETAGAPSPELGLIGDSVNSAAARLRFFRLAFGAAQPGTRVALTDLRAAVDSLLGGGRSRIRIDAHDAQLPRQTAKLLLLALLCQDMALPLGGDSHVSLEPTGFRIETEASRMRDLAPLWAIAERATPAERITPGEVQFLLLGMALAELGTPLVRQMREDGLSLEIAGLPG